jgi:hypothetical protein
MDKIKKISTGIASVIGVVGLAVVTMYWLDLDDAMIKKSEPLLKKMAELKAKQKAAAAAAIAEAE